MSQRAWMRLQVPGGGKPRHYAGAKPIVGNTGVVAVLPLLRLAPARKHFMVHATVRLGIRS